MDVCGSGTYHGHLGQLGLVYSSAAGRCLHGGRGVRVAEVLEGADGPPGLQVLGHPDRGPLPALSCCEIACLTNKSLSLDALMKIW